MITSGFTYLAVIIFFSGAVVWTEKSVNSRLFKYLPAIVLIDLGTLLLSTCGLWE